MLSASLLLILQFGAYCAGEARPWEEAGFQAPCQLLNPVRPAHHLGALETAWSLTPDQAQCALNALSARPIPDDDFGSRPDASPWRTCIARWPQLKVFWVGLFNARGDAGALVSLLSEPLAEDLYLLRFASHAELALHLLKSKPERLEEFLDGNEGWSLASRIWAERPASIRAQDWEPLARRFLADSLFSGHLVLAADFWTELPEPVRNTLRETPLLHEKQDLRAQLALALLLGGQKEEAVLVPPEGDPLLSDVVRWNLSGQRTISAWEAGIESRDPRRWFRSNEIRAALYPFIAPHFGLSDARAVVHDGFVSEVSGDSAFSRRLRSARARAFLLLKDAVEKTSSVASARPNTEPVREMFSAYLAENGCPPDAIRQAWGDVTLKPREPNSWTLELPRNTPWGEPCNRPMSWHFRRPTVITLNGDDHAYIEVRLGAVRADRDPSSGKLQLKMLWAAIQ